MALRGGAVAAPFIARGAGCRVCKQSAWLKILGSGMVDPEVFKNVGYDPEELKRIADFIRDFVRSAHREYYRRNLEPLSSEELDGKGSRFAEIMSLFFYHIYRKLVREEYLHLRKKLSRKGTR